jgi:undecaprenyl-diphosphatase
MVHPIQAALLGLVEGLTEYLPISSTGHLILASRVLGLRGDAVNSFSIVIQSGAIAAVCGLYWPRLRSMALGLLGRDAQGARLARNLAISFLPAAVVGLALHRWIRGELFLVRPVVVALAVGGIAMLAVDRWLRRGGEGAAALEDLTAGQAALIGAFQCLSLWPGMSRSMVTILGGVFAGLPAARAAEYSFLLALPTLGAATVFEAATGGAAIARDIGPLAIACGFGAAFGSACLAIRWLLGALRRVGLAPFGWYRLALAAVVWMVSA